MNTTKPLALAAASALLLVTLSTAMGQAAKPAANPARVAPYAFQGDQLGVMTLDDFTAKYDVRPFDDDDYGLNKAESDAISAAESKYAGDFAAKTAAVNAIFAAMAARHAALSTSGCGTPWEGVAGEQSCTRSHSDSIAGEPADISYYFLEGKLERIEVRFGHWRFDVVRDALTHKYGLPRRFSGTYRNGFGSTFSGLALTWDNGVSDIEMDEIDQGADMSNVTFEHKGLAAKRRRLLGRRNP
jgi:hypothetical protein